MLSGRKEKTLPVLLLFTLWCSFYLAAATPTNLPEGTVITFPAQDDLNIETGMGSFCGSPSIVLDHFENYVKTNAPKNYIGYNPYKISVKGGDNYLYVYSSKACRRLSKYVSANIFVMARVHLVR